MFSHFQFCFVINVILGKCISKFCRVIPANIPAVNFLQRCCYSLGNELLMPSSAACCGSARAWQEPLASHCSGCNECCRVMRHDTE